MAHNVKLRGAKEDGRTLGALVQFQHVQNLLLLTILSVLLKSHKMERKIMADISNLVREVGEMEASVSEAVVLIKDILAQLANQPGVDQAVIDDLANRLDAAAATLASADDPVVPSEPSA